MWPFLISVSGFQHLFFPLRSDTGAKCFAIPDARLPLEHYNDADVLLDAIGSFKLGHPYFS